MKKILVFVLCIVIISGFMADYTLNVQAIDQSSHKLTEIQISAMSYYTAEQLRAAISTPDDAIAYLNMRFPTLWMSYHIWQGMDSGIAILRSGKAILDDTVETDAGKGNAGRSDIVTALSYLLGDDMKIGSIYGFRHFSDGSLGPVKAVNYIYANGTYNIFDPVLGMTGDMGSRNGEHLPEMTVSSLDEYANSVKS